MTNFPAGAAWKDATIPLDLRFKACSDTQSPVVSLFFDLGGSPPVEACESVIGRHQARAPPCEAVRKPP